MPAKGTKSTKTIKPKVTRSNVAKSSSKTGLLSKKIKFNWKIAAVIGVILVAALGYMFVRLSQAGNTSYFNAGQWAMEYGERQLKNGSPVIMSKLAFNKEFIKAEYTTADGTQGDNTVAPARACIEYTAPQGVSVSGGYVLENITIARFSKNTNIGGRQSDCFDVPADRVGRRRKAYFEGNGPANQKIYLHGFSITPIATSVPSPAPGAKNTAPAPQAGICEGQNAFGPGSQGGCVRIIQQRLTDLGYQPGTVDGVYGQNTANAVKVFQQRSGLTQDGVVGPQTWNALTSSNAARKQ